MKELDLIVDAMEGEIVSLLQKLIQIPSENPPGNYSGITDFLVRSLSEFGFEVSVVSAPDDVIRDFGLEPPRPNVIAVLKGNGTGRDLVFNAHLDTVPAGSLENWTYPPFSASIDNGRVYGRGATDSKARLAGYIAAAVALQRSGIARRGSITIAATCDEETGGALGAGYVARNGLVKGEMVIVEGYSNQIVRAMAGVLQLRIISHGKPAHAGFKWKGINAIEKMAKVISGLAALQREYEKSPSSIPGMRYTTVNVGVVQGGTKVNVVPGDCEVEVDLRVIPEMSLQDVYAQIRNMVAELEANDSEMNVTIERIAGFETEPTVTESDSPLITELQQAVREVNGETLPVVGMMGQTDGRWFIENGMPAISYGPGTNDNHLHGYDEFVDIADLINTTKVLAVFARHVVG